MVRPAGGHVSNWVSKNVTEPWRQLSSSGRTYVLIVLAGLLLGFFGDVVYWYEHGYAYFDQALSPTEPDPTQALYETGGLWLFVHSVLFLLATFVAGRWARFSVGVFTVMGVALLYLALTAWHPIPLAPGILLSAAALVHLRNRGRLGDEEPAEQVGGGDG